MPPSSKQNPRSPPPQILEGRDIASVAKYIKSNKCRNIIFMLGAGVSTSAGIPDFRSPDTGLYANLHHLNLSAPEDVFDIGYFKRNPKPFYVLAKELRPGKFRPTITHSFVRLIHEKGLLLRCFTQNIDTLERRAGIPENKLVEAHGSFASSSCIMCGTSYDDDKMMEAIDKQKIARCPECKTGLVKPDIVFFGQSLPDNFSKSLPVFPNADLLIIIGTSLTVFPFASLIDFTRPDCPRIVINLERPHNIYQRRDDVFLLGRCDEIVEQLSRELGWHDDLLKLWAKTEIKAPGKAKEEVKSAHDEVEELAEAINKQIKLEEEATGEKLPEPDLTPSDPSKPSIKVEATVTTAEEDKPRGEDKKSPQEGDLGAAEEEEKETLQEGKL